MFLRIIARSADSSVTINRTTREGENNFVCLFICIFLLSKYWRLATVKSGVFFSTYLKKACLLNRNSKGKSDTRHKISSWFCLKRQNTVAATQSHLLALKYSQFRWKNWYPFNQNMYIFIRALIMTSGVFIPWLLCSEWNMFCNTRFPIEINWP